VSYTTKLIKYAAEFQVPLSVEYSELRFVYKVSIDKVVFKNGYVRHPIHGFGYTIEDACFDYIKQATGGELIHYLTDHTIEIT
jgi:hypothetical protein